VIYLAPGDYHRFHSPTNIQILKRLKIPGKCDAVREESLLNGSKYEKNARISLFSEWSQGLLSMVMIGALNVTRIHINDASTLKKGE
jgi:phosphatidylserine decarboxylase